MKETKMEYLSLRNIEKRTGISRPTLIKYANKYWKQLAPHTAKTNSNRLIYSVSAIPLFELYRQEGISKRGKKRG
jgi:predicted DNA-binding transcriptional regulator AlpA